jgi:hypothetical protein
MFSAPDEILRGDTSLLSSTSAFSRDFCAAISLITTNGVRSDPWRWIHSMVDLFTHPT